MKLTIFRRKALGMGMRTVAALLNGVSPDTVSLRRFIGERVNIIRNDQPIEDDGGFLFRWGCTSTTPYPLERQINKSTGIKTVNDKGAFRRVCMASGVRVPKTIFTPSPEATYPLVVRPTRHAQGRHLYIAENYHDLRHIVTRNEHLIPGWYASTLIDKVAEYRVFVLMGRVINVSQKIPGDPDAIAWNVAQGGMFENVRFGSWPMDVVRLALQCFKETGLDYSGIDVMVARDGTPYIIEANSAASMPAREDGEASYRQRCLAKGMDYIMREGKDHFEYRPDAARWNDVIHPAIGGH